MTGGPVRSRPRRTRAWFVLTLAAMSLGVVGSPAGAQVSPNVSVSPAAGPVGSAVTVTGADYLSVCAAPGIAITVSFGGAPVATTTTGLDGTFQVDTVVPSLDAGPHEIVASCHLPEPGPGLVSASTSFEVIDVAAAAPVVPAEPPSEPATPEPPGATAQEPPPLREGTSRTPAATAEPAEEPDGSGEADADVATIPSAEADVPTAGPVEGVPVGAPALRDDPPFQEAADGPVPVAAWGVSGAIPDISDVQPTGESLLASALAIGLFILLIGFPSVLFNGTFRRHYDRILDGARQRFPRAHEVGDAVTGRFPRLPLLVAALAGGTFALLLDPEVALDRRTLWLLAGLSGVAGLASWLGWLPTKLRSDRYGNEGHYRAYPAAMFIAVGCVVVSRAAGFHPGYLYGLLFAYHLQGRWTQRDDGATFAMGFGAVLLVGVGAWMTLPLVRTAEGASGAAVALETFVVGLTLAGIEGVVLGMLPFTFTPGRVVWDWSRGAFLAVYAPGLLAFWMLLSGPDRSLLGLDGMSGPSAQAVVAFLLWAGVSVAFWQYWRRRTRREQADSGLTVAA